MHELAREAIAFTANKTLDEVKSDRVLSLALVHLVEIIGEAATHVS